MSAKAKDEESAANRTLAQESELNALAAAKEDFETRMAFESYYKMGETQALSKVAREIGRGITTIERWSSDYRWTARIKERERAAAEYLIMQQSAQEEADQKKKHLTLIDASIATWATKLTENKIKLDSVDDLAKLVRLRWDTHKIPDRRANPTAAIGHGGSSIDLRLRNMDRGELQQFLYSTMKSIERVMNKKGLPEPQLPTVGKQGGEKMNLDIRLSTTGAVDNSADVVDISDAEPVAPVGVEDLDLDIDLD